MRASYRTVPSPIDSRISDVTEGIPNERRQQSSDDTFGRRCYRAGRLQKRLQWTLAVVDELLTGNDGLTRAARLGISSRITTRPTVKLYPLEVHCDDN
ncbi:hypothetical protein DPMN_111734 [Dreissena polymorpha]|uniref:DUF5641 domain-containing protein n=1 Tax=Dreissena polymorpha TaxID=45954 RepID=A0A9D4KEU0_DREPO|nr:hypothetical protein DPMN_111734 [Dreissena polymorpha]